MSSPAFLFGPRPKSALLRSLGLLVSHNEQESGSSSAADHLAQLDKWRRRCEHARRKIEEDSVIPTVHPAASDAAGRLLDEVCRVGQRLWVGGVLGRDSLILTAADLREWCLLQARALICAWHCLPVVFIYRGASDDPLTDCDLIGLAAPLLRPRRPRELWHEFDEVSADLKQLRWVTPADEEEHEIASYVLQDRLPSGVSQATRSYIVQRAWGYARQFTAQAADPLPDMPPTAGAYETAHDALLLLYRWVQRVAEAVKSPAPAGPPPAARPNNVEAQEDGPERPDVFWFRGVPYPRLSPLELQLLELLWEDCRDKPRWKKEIRLLLKPMYNGRVDRSNAIRLIKKRLSRKLADLKFPGELEEDSGYFILTLYDAPA